MDEQLQIYETIRMILTSTRLNKRSHTQKSTQEVTQAKVPVTSLHLYAQDRRH